MAESGRLSESVSRWSVAAQSALAGAAVTLLAYLVSRPDPFDPADEGMRLLLSSRWAAGGSLFDVFQPIYPPGQYVYFGVLLRLLGGTLDSLRLAHALLGGVAAAILFVALRRLGPLAGAWLGALALALPLYGTVKTLAAILVLLLALTVSEERALSRAELLRWGALAGALVGWREDAAVLAWAALAYALWRIRSWRATGITLAGAAGGLGAWWLLFALRGDGLAFLWHVTFRVVYLAIRLRRPMRVAWQLPNAPLADAPAVATALLPLFWVLPPLLYLGLLVWAWRRRRSSAPVDRQIVAAAVVGCCYLPQYLWERNDLAHAFDHRPILFAVAVVLLQRVNPRMRRAGLALFGAVALSTAVAFSSSPLRAPAGRPYPTASARSWGLRLPAIPPWVGLPREKGETMIVLGWGPGWYLLEGIAPGTSFLSSAARHLRWGGGVGRMLDDLSAPSNRWVLATPGTEGSEPIWKVLDERYVLRERWHAYELWEHRASDSARPKAVPDHPVPR
jgi:hypothetical protein